MIFKTLVECLLKRERDADNRLVINATHTLIREITNDLTQAFVLSEPLVQRHPTRFWQSRSYLDFLIQLADLPAPTAETFHLGASDSPSLEELKQCQQALQAARQKLDQAQEAWRTERKELESTIETLQKEGRTGRSECRLETCQRAQKESQARWEACQQEVSECREEKERLQRQVKEGEKKLKSAQDALKSIQEINDDLNTSLKESVQNAEALQKDLKKCLAEKKQLQADLDARRRKQSDLQMVVASEEPLAATLALQSQLDTQLQTSQHEIQKWQHGFQSLHHHMTRLSHNNRALADQVRELTFQCHTLQDEHSQTLQANQALLSENDTMQQQTRAVLDSVVQLAKMSQTPSLEGAACHIEEATDACPPPRSDSAAQSLPLPWTDASVVEPTRLQEDLDLCLQREKDCLRRLDHTEHATAVYAFLMERYYPKANEVLPEEGAVLRNLKSDLKRLAQFQAQLVRLEQEADVKADVDTFVDVVLDLYEKIPKHAKALQDIAAAARLAIDDQLVPNITRYVKVYTLMQHVKTSFHSGSPEAWAEHFSKPLSEWLGSLFPKVLGLDPADIPWLESEVSWIQNVALHLDRYNAWRRDLFQLAPDLSSDDPAEKGVWKTAFENQYAQLTECAQSLLGSRPLRELPDVMDPLKGKAGESASTNWLYGYIQTLEQKPRRGASRPPKNRSSQKNRTLVDECETLAKQFNVPFKVATFSKDVTDSAYWKQRVEKSNQWDALSKELTHYFTIDCLRTGKLVGHIDASLLKVTAAYAISPMPLLPETTFESHVRHYWAALEQSLKADLAEWQAFYGACLKSFGLSEDTEKASFVPAVQSRQHGDWSAHYQQWLKALGLSEGTRKEEFLEKLKLHKSGETKRSSGGEKKRSSGGEKKRSSDVESSSSSGVEKKRSSDVHSESCETTGEKKMRMAGNWSDIEIQNFCVALYKEYFTLKWNHLNRILPREADLLQKVERKMELLEKVNPEKRSGLLFKIYAQYIELDLAVLTQKIDGRSTRKALETNLKTRESMFSNFF